MMDEYEGDREEEIAADVRFRREAFYVILDGPSD